ncbi:MAG: hypothetical protein JSW39_06275, partial [Desulfobacterales bacterium]
IGLDRVENFLNLLDEYCQMLGDPRKTLKDIQPLVASMTRAKEDLTPLLHTLPDGHGIKDILNQTLVTASLEIIKFNRGDYITT